MYITEDTGKIYVDVASGPFEDDEDDKLYRIVLNAESADKLKKVVTLEDGSSSETIVTAGDIIALQDLVTRIQTNVAANSLEIIAVKDDLEEITTNLLSEVTRALEAEQALDQKITDEIERAKAAELANANNITILQNNDTSLQLSMSALGDKIDSELIPLIDAISGDLDKEVDRATQAETSLQSMIEQETERARTAEELINTQVTANTAAIENAGINQSNIAIALGEETARATAAEEALDTKIADETARATGVEEGLIQNLNEADAAIAGLRADVDTNTLGIAANSEAIEEEASTARAAESALDKKIADEQARAEGIEEAYGERLNSLENLYTTANADITGNTFSIRKNAEDILTETGRATGVETELNGKIVSETDRATGAEIDLSGRIGTVESANTTIIADIQKNADDIVAINENLSKEITRATSAELLLSEKIDTETSRAQNAEETLSNRINANVTAIATNRALIDTNKDDISNMWGSDYPKKDEGETPKSIRDIATDIVQSLVIEELINADNEDDNVINKLAEIVEWLNGTEEGSTLGDILDEIDNVQNQLWGYKDDYSDEKTVGGALRDIDVLQSDVSGLSANLETLSDTVHEEPNTLTSGSYGPSADATPDYGTAFTVPQVTVDARGRVIAAANKTVTIPTSDNTDTKVTSVDNHYAPTANTSSELSADAASTTAATWNSTSLVTGVNLQRDAAGHVTGITVDSIRMPANPDTDTHYTANLVTGSESTDTTNKAANNGSVYMNLVEAGTVRNSHKIVGSGATTVTTDSNGIITISSTDTNTTYSAATTSAPGLMSAADKSKLDGIATGANNYTYTLPAATSSTLGGVKVGSNITVSSGTISLSKTNVTDALGYTPPSTNTTYSAATTSAAGLMSAADKTKLDGITASADTVSFSRSLTSGTKIGTITINGTATDLYCQTNTDTNTDTKVTTAANTSSTKSYVTTCTGATTGTLTYHTGVYVDHSKGVLYGAAWNDFAEYRHTDERVEPGRVVCENGDDSMSVSTKRLQPGASIVSDTFGFAIGETEYSQTPVAVAGRVLVYPYEDRNTYKPGDAVCAAPGGTVSKMTREEIMMYPERIVGTVSAIPEYKTWGEGNVSVNGRIWIKVR